MVRVHRGQALLDRRERMLMRDVEDLLQVPDNSGELSSIASTVLYPALWLASTPRVDASHNAG